MDDLEDLRELLRRIPNLPIMHVTQCKAANHIWAYSSSGSMDEPEDTMRCDCGMFTWKMAKILNENPEA